jgi:TolA-binding protein
MKKIIYLLLVALTIAASAGCSDNKPSELFETARFEELQNNEEHAVKLYQEIIRKYPASEEAKKAEKRLAEIQEGK